MRKAIANIAFKSVFQSQVSIKQFSRIVKTPYPPKKEFTPAQPQVLQPTTLEQAKLKEEMDLVTSTKNIKSLLELSKSLTKTSSKVQLLQRLSYELTTGSLAKQRPDSLKSEGFQSLLENLKKQYNDSMPDAAKVSILLSLLKLKYRDTQLLGQASDLVAQGKIRNINSITNILYVFAKFKYQPKTPTKPKKDQSSKNINEVQSSLFMSNCSDLLKAELVLPVPTVCRNLWNFYALQYYDKELFDKFGDILVKNHDRLEERDVANAMKSFAYFKHVNYEVMESLIKVTIKNCQLYKYQSLAVITNSLAELDIQNLTVFNIIKSVILKDNLQGAEPEAVDTQALKPIDCAQFMTAFCRVKLFDLEFLEFLEHAFVKRIDEASGESLVTMFTSHASWSLHMIEQCLIKKSQPRRVYSYFKKYNEEFYEHMAVNLIRNIKEINLKGVFLVLAHGNMAHLKRRSNVRLMRQFAVKGVETLNDERKSINDEKTFEGVCAKYYEYSVRYCLNTADRGELTAKFKEVLDIDIVELCERISPLGFKFKFSDDLPSEESRQKLVQAVKEDDQEHIDEQEAQPENEEQEENSNKTSSS